MEVIAQGGKNMYLMGGGDQNQARRRRPLKRRHGAREVAWQFDVSDGMQGLNGSDVQGRGRERCHESPVGTGRAVR